MTKEGRFKGWQAVTISLLVLGYAGYYLCRSDYSVALPLIIADLGGRGVPAAVATIRLGSIASLGVLAYAIGKFPSGGVADFLGGKRNFLLGMAGSVIFTILFALGGGMPFFTVAWIGNRLVQSTGWAGTVKVASRWFSYSTYGAAMGLISLSFLFGDAASRQFMAVLIAHGVGWRGVFLAAGGTLGVLLIFNLLLLKESPRDVGLEEPPTNPLNVFKEDGERHAPAGLKELLKPLLGCGVFWLVCLLSFGFTIVRETFNLWTPTYFTQAVGLSNAGAAETSALFPLFGGISVLAAGFLSDHFGTAGRAAIILYGLVLTGITLLALAYANLGSSKFWPVLLVTLVAFLMLGPYSYLAGAIALDFGGKQGSATASGFIDGVGYLGGVLAGNTVAQVSVAYGWRGAFAMLAGVAWLSSAAAAVYWAHQRRANYRQNRRGGTMNVIDEILRLFETRGDEAYFGEPVSQKEHALQAAHQAEQEGATAALVVAALLHDIGHLIHNLPEDIADRGVDARHEAAGEAWLTQHFPAEVTEAVKLHVAAKRYLCKVDSEYLPQLSPASVQSLSLQGGPFSDAEVREFEQNQYFRQAVRLRRWDDRAKIPGLAVPGLEHYRPALEESLRATRD